MRFTAALCLVAIAACGGDDVGNTTTVAQHPLTTTSTTTAPESTSVTEPATTTSTAPAPGDGDGSESIGVTDSVTIVITDPED